MLALYAISMATIISGKRKGEQVELNRCAVDSFILADGTEVKPTQLQFTEREAQHVLFCPNTFGMTYKYELLPSLKFKRRLVN